MATKFYARITKDGRKQFLKDHLKAVAKISFKNACKIGFGNIGKYIGLSHDLGKYTDEWQDYLLKNNRKEKIDHSTLGGKFCYKKVPNNSFLKELITLCNFSHHSNLMDMIDIRGKDKFTGRTNNAIDINEALKNMDDELKKEIENTNFAILEEEINKIKNKIDKHDNNLIKKFYYGMTAKFLLSCLIDADHTNSADFERGYEIEAKSADWGSISKRLEKYIANLNKENKSADNIKIIRKQISDDCSNAGKIFRNGCYQLEVPTGGGKTLASFRFAVEMAKQHKADRIVYAIPYTTIIEQNAKTIRDIVEKEEKDKGKFVLEHHSNIAYREKEDDKESNSTELYMQNWNIPIIFTTNVQLLEVMFGHRTTDTRKLHQLANSIIIFDEIQTLPIKCVHIFNNAINFLVDHCGTTVVLCTATQPLLDKVDEKNGSLKISENSEIIKNRSAIEKALTRVNIIPELKGNTEPYSNETVAKNTMEFASKNNNCLVVCNTTKTAKEIFQIINSQKNNDFNLYHLSARMMPIHRKTVLQQIKNKLDGKERIILVSTQVIEAGVDIDFNCGIRALAGLDSIIQTAGRINRNGNLKDDNGLLQKGELHIYNFDENVKTLAYIEIGKKTTKNILKKFPNTDLLDSKIINAYYDYSFYKQAREMKYRIAHENNLLDLLSENKKQDNKYKLTLTQAFKEASGNFKVIDDITRPICIETEEVREIIDRLEYSFDFSEKYRLIKALQQYTVNIYPNQIKDCRAMQQIKNFDINYISKCYYNENFGITEEAEIDLSPK